MAKFKRNNPAKRSDDIATKEQNSDTITDNTKHIVAIVGSRSFNNETIVRDVFLKHILLNAASIVSGGAKGADSLGSQIAAEYGVAVDIFKPKWKTKTRMYNPRAGFERNVHIITAADAVWAFWDMYSNGTRDSMQIAKQSNKPIWVTTPQGTTFKLQHDWALHTHLYIVDKDETLNAQPHFSIDSLATLKFGVFSLLEAHKHHIEEFAVASLDKALYVKYKSACHNLAKQLSEQHALLLLILQ